MFSRNTDRAIWNVSYFEDNKPLGGCVYPSTLCLSLFLLFGRHPICVRVWNTSRKQPSSTLGCRCSCAIIPWNSRRSFEQSHKLLESSWIYQAFASSFSGGNTSITHLKKGRERKRGGNFTNTFCRLKTAINTGMSAEIASHVNESIPSHPIASIDGAISNRKCFRIECNLRRLSPVSRPFLGLHGNL